MSDMRKFCTAFVNTHPIQYLAALRCLSRAGRKSLRSLSDFSVRGSLDRAFGQTAKWDVNPLSGYDTRFIKGAGLRNERVDF